MADKKITDLPKTETVSDSDLLIVETGNGTRAVASADLLKNSGGFSKRASRPVILEAYLQSNSHEDEGIIDSIDIDLLKTESGEQCDTYIIQIVPYGAGLGTKLSKDIYTAVFNGDYSGSHMCTVSYENELSFYTELRLDLDSQKFTTRIYSISGTVQPFPVGVKFIIDGFKSN